MYIYIYIHRERERDWGSSPEATWHGSLDSGCLETPMSYRTFSRSTPNGCLLDEKTSLPANFHAEARSDRCRLNPKP